MHRRLRDRAHRGKARKGKDLAARALGSRPTTYCPGHARKTRHRPSYETIWPPRPPAARQDRQRRGPT